MAYVPLKRFEAYRSYTLDDLENDDEFQQTSERFLESIGEKSDDVFEYL